MATGRWEKSMIQTSAFHPGQRLYRFLFSSEADTHAAYIYGYDVVHARRRMEHIVSMLFDLSVGDIAVVQSRSYTELVEQGVSPDIDRRVFEFSFEADGVVSWVDNPLILSPEPMLLGLWHEIRHEVGYERMCQLLRRYRKTS